MATQILQMSKQVIKFTPNANGIVQITAEGCDLGYLINSLDPVYADEFANIIRDVPYTFEVEVGEFVYIKGSGKLIVNEGTVTV